jgi:hypothetical protein
MKPKSTIRPSSKAATSGEFHLRNPRRRQHPPKTNNPLKLIGLLLITIKCKIISRKFSKQAWLYLSKNSLPWRNFPKRKRNPSLCKFRSKMILHLNRLIL